MSCREPAKTLVTRRLDLFRRTVKNLHQAPLLIRDDLKQQTLTASWSIRNENNLPGNRTFSYVRNHIKLQSYSSLFHVRNDIKLVSSGLHTYFQNFRNLKWRRSFIWSPEWHETKPSWRSPRPFANGCQRRIDGQIAIESDKMKQNKRAVHVYRLWLHSKRSAQEYKPWPNSDGPELVYKL